MLWEDAKGGDLRDAYP